MLDAVKKLVSKFKVGEDQTHFSIITYAGDPELRVKLNDNLYHSNDALQQFLDGMKNNDKLGSPTRTDKALKMVGEKVFVSENGDRPKSPNIMIIFTDGGTHKNSESYDTVLPKLEVSTQFKTKCMSFLNPHPTFFLIVSTLINFTLVS